MSFEMSAIVLSWLAILALAFAMSGLLRQVQVLTTALVSPGRGRIGPALGTTAPSVDGLGGANGWPTRTALVFADSSCATCGQALDELFSLTRAEGDELELVVVYSQDGPVGKSENVRVLTHQSDAFARFGISTTPFAVGVNAGGMVVAAEPIGSRHATGRFFNSLRERTVA